MYNISFWIGFNIIILIMLMLDLGIFHKKDKEESVKKALVWSAVWISLSMLFNVFIYYKFGSEKALEFFTAYIIEKALSVDNIFVFILIFSFFKIPSKYQHKVLFYGILVALLMRLIFIFAGVALLEKFSWMIYIFGGILIFTGIKMLLKKEEENDLSKNKLIIFLKNKLPFTDELHGHAFSIKKNKKILFTPLFLVLIVIELTDVIFAVDSIPAILAITQDKFIVYTSNIFAILGLRSLYFALSGIMSKFKYLSLGLSIILIFIGIKMAIVNLIHIPILFSLLFILFILLISMIFSFLKE